MDAGWTPLLGVGGGLLLTWLVLVAAPWRARPDEVGAREVLRLLPDVVRLVRRLAADPTLDRGLRARLWLLLAHLAMPIDLAPDVLPVIGWADDVVVVALVLRSVVRRPRRRTTTAAGLTRLPATRGAAGRSGQLRTTSRLTRP